MLLGSLALAGSASAQDALRAAPAFERGQAAEVAGEASDAARWYEMADRLAPTPEALRSAARMRRAAGQLPMACTHAQGLRLRYPGDLASTQLASEILDAHRDSVVRVEVRCADDCELLLDGLALGLSSAMSHTFYVSEGEHRVTGVFRGGRSRGHQVEGSGGTTVSLSLEQTEVDIETNAPRARTRSGSGGASLGPVGSTTSDQRGALSPWLFVSGALLSVGMGATAVWSALDTQDARDRYDQMPTLPAYRDGLDRELRTNLMLAGTGVLALTTLFLGLFADWGEESPPAQLSVVVEPSAGHVWIGMGGSL